MPYLKLRFPNRLVLQSVRSKQVSTRGEVDPAVRPMAYENSLGTTLRAYLVSTGASETRPVTNVPYPGCEGPAQPPS